MVEWVLGGVRSDWQAAAFQATLASPDAFAAHYIDLHQDAAGDPEVPHTQTAPFVSFSIWTTDHAMYMKPSMCGLHGKQSSCLPTCRQKVQHVHAGSACAVTKK